MIDRLRADCDGFVLVPEIVFTMQSIDQLIAYGKCIFWYRANIHITDRGLNKELTKLDLQCTQRWAAYLGDVKKQY